MSKGKRGKPKPKPRRVVLGKGTLWYSAKAVGLSRNGHDISLYDAAAKVCGANICLVAEVLS